MVRSDTAARVDASRLVLLCVAAWALPGAGHLWLGRRSKGLVVLFALSAMYGVGLALDGRLFPFETSQPLVFLAAVADTAMGLWYVLAWAGGFGRGQVIAWTYEYANAFLIVAGLMNMLVVLDVYDTAVGRK